LIQLPEEIIKEVENISKPSDSSILKPAYVYDFLLCKSDLNKDSGILIKKKFKDFRWAEVKTGYSLLSKRQIRTLKKIKIPLYRYRIPYSLSESTEVEIYYDLVDSKFLSEHWLDSEGNTINMQNNSFKKNKTSFKKVTPEKFLEVKQGLKKLFQVTRYQSNDPNISERFEITKTGAKFHVLYYKKGTLLIQGDESLEGFNKVIKLIEFSLENDS